MTTASTASDPSKNMLFDRVCLIGLGLIASSLAWAMKKHGLAGHIVGTARSEATCLRALELGFVDSVDSDMAKAVENADLVMICTPLGAFATVAKTIASSLKSGVIVSDVGSSKASAIKDIRTALPETAVFIGGHPIAGTENSGPDAGFAELFEGRYCILTPEDDCPDAAIKALRQLWEKVGSIVELMTPTHHDRVLAITSHLPHLIAYSIVGTAADLESQMHQDHMTESELVKTSEVIRFSAGGFRDFTRIAGSDPTMWRDIFLSNKDAVLEMLGRFSEDLVALQRSIRHSEGDKLFDLFTRTREVRRGIIEQKQAGTFNAMELEKVKALESEQTDD